jgi:hypothetical protein
MTTRSRWMFAVGALWLSAGVARAQSRDEQVLSTRSIRSGETIELLVERTAPHRVVVSIRSGTNGNDRADHFTGAEIGQWLAGKPHGPAPLTMVERAPSAGLNGGFKDSSAPLGDVKTGRTIVVLLGEEDGEATYALVLRHVSIPLRKQELLQFLRDMKRAAEVADSLAGKKN